MQSGKRRCGSCPEARGRGLYPQPHLSRRRGAPRKPVPTRRLAMGNQRRQSSGLGGLARRIPPPRDSLSCPEPAGLSRASAKLLRRRNFSECEVAGEVAMHKIPPPPRARRAQPGKREPPPAPEGLVRTHAVH
ncbi:hypothetical protein DR999_PMT12656 [Platysternon megacephalum]|uniref:Uncharacterized protein n=1 Tax=Platysternon megacephalum TaxID=55544 RepID=A0A4D9E3B3_9SAUR|nr:hypothetical protein DR999_PMT12656 [Platysternon megacephalum]